MREDTGERESAQKLEQQADVAYSTIPIQILRLSATWLHQTGQSHGTGGADPPARQTVNKGT